MTSNWDGALRRCRGDAERATGLCRRHAEAVLVQATLGTTWLVIGVETLAVNIPGGRRLQLLENSGRLFWPSALALSLIQAFGRRFTTEVRASIIDALPEWMQQTDMEAVKS